MIRPSAVARCLALSVVLGFVVAAHADPRPPEVMNGAAICLALQKLQVVGSALYVGAHPDDENTAMLAWLSKGRKVRTAYLSLTRGDGGQNLIGTDIGERLGVIRTQELLAARRVDGAEQFFTRAVDFGFSKGPDETLAIWGRDSILADVVWVIRRFQPDVIITRFPTDGSGGHGHHTASAILAEEAFAAAADSTRFPEQLRWVPPWQAKRIVWNVTRFGNAGPDTTPGRITVDLGGYEPLLGRSFTEIAGEARSMHKTQGFGAAERRGSFTNAFEHRAGVRASKDLFEGVELTWARIPGGAKLAPILAQAEREFRAEKPQAILPLLLRAHAVLVGLPDRPIVLKKRAELIEVIRCCSGLWLEAVAGAATGCAGSDIRIVTAAINRSDVPIRLEHVEVVPSNGGNPLTSRESPRVLSFNRPTTDTLRVTLPPDLMDEVQRLTQPYWLENRPTKGLFVLTRPEQVGDAENPPLLSARMTLSILGERLLYELPVVYRWTDPVQGERYREFEGIPLVTLHFDHPTYLFPDERPRPIRITLKNPCGPDGGELRLILPPGWSASPKQIAVGTKTGFADTTVTFDVVTGQGGASGEISAVLEQFDAVGVEDMHRVVAFSFGTDLTQIDYPHIPTQILLPPARARLVRANLRTAGRAIGYVMGAGDEIPDALREMGYAVTMLSDDDVDSGDLSRFDAIVIGVRAYNTRPRLLGDQRRLLDWVAGGGRLVVQYQTPDNALNDRLGPFPFSVSRDRVTVEEAPVRFLKPDHALLTTPNRISASDFDGWVQERGLWFANPWDPRYETVLSCNDPGEPARDGGLLVARHGSGTFIYTGYAFFRQLPAGVPGAWRLFANLVSAAPSNGTRPAAGQ